MTYVLDSRDVQPGDTFVALIGANVDGHDYLEEVKRRGAAKAIVSRKCPVDIEQEVVNDTVEALQALASQVALKVPVRIGITGSLGKTTTKEFVRTLLQDKYVFVTPKSMNSQVGLPVAILNGVKGGEEALILEMGISMPGEMDKLVEMVRPTHAVITCIEMVHAEHLGGLEGIAGEKRKIFKYGEEISFEPCHLPHLPKHIAPCVGAAMAIARILGGSPEKFLDQLKMPEGRLHWKTIEGVHFLNDAYNAAEVSMKGAIDVFVDHPTKGKRLAILGDMREIGADSRAVHERVKKYAEERVDALFCFGALWGSVDRSEMERWLFENAKSGDSVLLKGANAHRLSELTFTFERK